MGQEEDAVSPKEKRSEVAFKYLRIFNIITALIVIGLSILSGILLFINALTSLRFFLMFSPVFMTGFGICLLAAEFKVRFILKRAPFLKSNLGRGLFYLFISSVVYFYFEILDSAVLAWASAIVLFVSGIVYLCIHFGCAKGLQKEGLEEEEEEEEDSKNTIRETLV